MSSSLPVAGVVIRDQNGRYLLVQERQAAAYGLWGLPAGHVDDGETPQQAAIREAYEETGFTVELVKEDAVSVDSSIQTGFTLYAFHAKITAGELVVQEEELLNAGWYSLNETEELAKHGKLRSAWVIDAISEVENYANHRD